jgi:hypothetical protein
LKSAEKDEDEEILVQRRNLGRVRRGLRTAAEDFYLPVLNSLVSRGGSDKVADVLEDVGGKMKQVLKEVDYEPLASDPSNPRWRNTTQWARYSMIQEELLKADSPRGIWEISDKGREYLQSAMTTTDDGSGVYFFWGPARYRRQRNIVESFQSGAHRIGPWRCEGRILNDPNCADDPQYIVRLIGKVITVSMERMKIVKSLSDL